jgi:hypothetical protein
MNLKYLQMMVVIRRRIHKGNAQPELGFIQSSWSRCLICVGDFRNQAVAWRHKSIRCNRSENEAMPVSPMSMNLLICV